MSMFAYIKKKELNLYKIITLVENLYFNKS